MRRKIQTIIEDGNDGILVDVECSLTNSLPNIIIVGFANKSIDEAKERIRGAFNSSKIKLPKKRITINLAPADIPKEGSGFDLAMVLSIMQAGELVSKEVPKNTVVLGEVGLDGSVRAIRGIIGKILAARKQGIKSFWIPQANMKQASLIPNIEILPISSLGELYHQLATDSLPAPKLTKQEIAVRSSEEKEHDALFEDIVGQDQAKRAMLIAAAGGHNIMLNGPPGTGKSMLAKALISILPDMTKEEMLEVTHLHSLARKDFDKIVEDRPLRSPHHSSSPIAIIGGGKQPRPGEISLSHRGILFFDEFPEFSRSIIESLRQPMEDRQVTVSRAKDSLRFPAHFLFVATANPCPCGNYGSKTECTCLPTQVMKYNKKISGPIVDRIDLHVYVDAIDHSSILSKNRKNARQSQKLAQSVAAARNKQINSKGKLNCQLSNREVKARANLTPNARQLLDQAAVRLNMSARGYIKMLKVSQTIADLEGEKIIDTPQISEALQYRHKPVVL